MYPYQELPVVKSEQQIRLLTLLPTNSYSDPHRDLIQCTLATCRLNQSSFKALSYCWGDPSVTRQILIDRHVIDVTENLEAALRHLRSPSDYLVIWVDAVCINQSDLEEKSWQVQQMGDIYRQAERVIAWLGPATQESDAAIAALGCIGDYVKNANLEHGVASEVAVKWAGYWEGTTDDNNTDAESDPDDAVLYAIFRRLKEIGRNSKTSQTAALKDLFGRSWWGRRWVIQEVLLAKDIWFVCGDAQLPGDYLMAADSLVQMFGLSYVFYCQNNLDTGNYIRNDELSNIAEYSPALLRLRRDISEDWTISGFFLFESIGQLPSKASPAKFQASVPRDNIYAMLGISAQVRRVKLKPDYNISDQEAFTRAAIAFLQSGDLQLLFFCQTPKMLSDLPSWTPDWSGRFRGGPNQCLGLYDASLAHPIADGPKDSPTAPKFEHYDLFGWEMLIEGVFVGTLDSVSPFRDHAKQPRNRRVKVRVYGWFHTVEKFVLDYLQEHPEAAGTSPQSVFATQQDIQSAIIRASCSGIELDFNTGVYSRISSETVASMSSTIYNDILIHNPKSDVTQDMTKYVSDVRMFTTQRRAFVVGEKYLGIGPSELQARDAIVVLRGADMPFALRPVDEGRFRLLGECFVDGIMYGEAVKNAEWGTLRII